MGWLIQETPNGKYKLGSRLLRVSAMVSQNVTAEEVILQEMNRLLNEYNEDVVLTAMVDGLPICVEKVHSSNMLRIQSKVGRVGNLVRGSTGKTPRSGSSCGTIWIRSVSRAIVFPSPSRTRESCRWPCPSGIETAWPATLWQ